MTLIALLIGILIIALLCWLVNLYMPPPFKTPALVILIVVGIIWVIVAMFPQVAGMRVP